MKKWLKKTAAAGLAALLLASLAGCGNDAKKAEEGKAAGYPVTWTETLDGKEVTASVEKAPSRAISMSQATTEMMLALGLEDKMVGTAMKEEDIYPPLQASYDKVKVLAEKWPSYETFMAEKPDFATGWEVPFTKRGIPADSITAQGVPIYIPSSMQKLDAGLDTVFDDMMKLGAIFGVEPKAQEWVDGQKKILADVQEKIKDLPKKRVFIYDASDGKPFTAYKGYTTNILKLMGGDDMGKRGRCRSRVHHHCRLQQRHTER